MEVREMHLYSEKVDAKDIEGFLNQMVKAKVPFLGFLDFSDILSLNAIRLVIKRKNNTVQLYIQERDYLSNVSSLTFPFKSYEPVILKTSEGSILPFPNLHILDGKSYNLLDFILKEDIEELIIDVTKSLGGFFATARSVNTKGRKGFLFIRNFHKFLSFDLERNSSIYIEILEPIPKKSHTSSNYPVFEDSDMSLGVDNFDPIQHTLFVGGSGTGKSRGLFVLLRTIEEKYRENIRVIVIDPHGEFIEMMPHCKKVNFVENYIEPLDIGSEKSPMLTQLLVQLVSSAIGKENKYSERVLFFTVHLLISIGKLSLQNINDLLTDAKVRAEFTSSCDQDEIKQFFDEEYNDIYLHHFNDAVLPILNFIGEYLLYMGKEKTRERLSELIKNNRVTVVSFDPSFFGKRMISFLSGAIISQMYIHAITGKLKDRPTILVVDEFPRVETRVTKDILSETRKFNLYAYLSCQYMGQLSKEVLDSIMSNVRNVISFKVTREDASLLSSMMEIKLEEYFKKSRATTELEESKKEMFIRLHQRECVVRLFDGTKYLLPMKLRVVDSKRWEYKPGYSPKNRRTPLLSKSQDRSFEDGEKPPFPPPMIDDPKFR